MRALSHFIIFIILTGGCSAKSPLDRKEASSAAAQGEVTPPAPTVNALPIDTDAQKAVTVEEKDEEEVVANEPISIGGAFLTCQYPADQRQGSDEYLLNCGLGATTDISRPIVKAEFYKVDSAGSKTSLRVQSQNLSTFTWTVLEPAETVFHTTVQAILFADNATTATVTTTVTSMNIVRAVKHWLGGEPNNAPQEGEDEDCAEYQNLAAKQDNEAISGLTNGPLGRLNDNQCSIAQKFICKSTAASVNPKWIISTFQGPFQDYAKACPAGYRFSLPMNDSEALGLNAVVDQVTGATRFWVPLHDRDTEGKFTIILK